MTGPLSADERTVLAVFAEATEPLDWGDVVESLLPSRPRWPRRGGKRAWAQRWEALVRATMALYKAGLLAEMPDDPADMTMITDAGREALWGPKPSGWIRTDATLTREQVEAWRRKWEAEASTAPTSAFWGDLNRRMQDPKFRRSYVKESLRIQAFDDRMNASPVDGAQAPAQPSSAPGSLPPRPGRPEAPH